MTGAATGPIVVLKFGGTSLATPARVRRAAARVRAHLGRGRRVVVVVSAVGRTTDRLLARLDAVVAAPPVRAPDAGGVPVGGNGRAGADGPRRLPTAPRLDRELDRLLATGENAAAALLAATLTGLGLPARSLRGGEAGIGAAGPFGAGRIADVDPGPLRRLLRAGVVPVVSGFQGVRPDGETVTLGRGGSDTTAVALAAALGAPCHIVTDVAGVYDDDPRLHPGARLLPALDHRSLVALIRNGARVVHEDAAILAADHVVPLHVYHYRAPFGGGGTCVRAARGATARNAPDVEGDAPGAEVDARSEEEADRRLASGAPTPSRSAWRAVELGGAP